MTSSETPDPDPTDAAAGTESKPAPRKRRQKDHTFRSLAIGSLAGVGRFIAAIPRAVTSFWGILIVVLLLIYAFAPREQAMQYVESTWQDRVSFDQSREGLIVVDTPQLFTRERLINERLEESAWIESQLDRVDQLLQAEKFAQADSISVTQSLISVLGKEDANLESVDIEKLGALARQLGTIDPTPLQQFQDAKNYRERLSLQRYDSILDDAHDIGSNTLHRMNFRLTLAPARARSDSLAAVSITVREPSDSRLLFDHYGRLVVETRKKMEETVASLLRDRMFILDQDFEFQVPELEMIDEILIDMVRTPQIVGPRDTLSMDEWSTRAERLADRLIDRVLEQQMREQELQARSFLYTLVNGIGIPELTKELMPHYATTRASYWSEDEGALSEYTRRAPENLIKTCGTPFSLTSILPDAFGFKDEVYLDLQNSYIEARMAEQQPAKTEDAGASGQQDRGSTTAGRAGSGAAGASERQPTGSQQTGGGAGTGQPVGGGGSGAAGPGGMSQVPLEAHLERALAIVRNAGGDGSEIDPDRVLEFVNTMVDEQKAAIAKVQGGMMKEMEGRNKLRTNFDTSLQQQFTYPCPTRKNQITLAKLRLIGRIKMLRDIAAPEDGQPVHEPCERTPAFREKLIAHIGSEAPPEGAGAEEATPSGGVDAQAGGCNGTRLLAATRELADRAAITGGDYARIGIALTMREKLAELRLDTSARGARLDMFFEFDVSRCDLKSCELRTRSKSEAIAERSGEARRIAQKSLYSKDISQSARIQDLRMAWQELKEVILPASAVLSEDSQVNAGFTGLGDVRKLAGEVKDDLEEIERRIRDAGREEALRLFLELRCYADARSYTVWPRSGERLASFEQDSTTSGARFDLDGTLQKLTGFQASDSSSTVSRHERDHIFGIGDWGAPSDSSGKAGHGLVPCNRDIEAVLDRYNPDGTFLKKFAGEIEDNAMGQDVRHWWAAVNDAYEKLRQEHVATLKAAQRMSYEAEHCRDVTEVACDTAFGHHWQAYCAQRQCDLSKSLEVLMQIAQNLELPNTQTKFSWIVAPRRETPRQASRHVPMSVPLSALISLPSWWGHAELTITTCWVRPKDLKDRIPTGNLCKDPGSESSGATRYTLNVPLPGKAQDVLQRIGFFIIRTPYLDTGWNEEEEVEAGRPARIRLTGSRLWKNPRVRIGNQWHDKIEVLPNMQGVIASFNCVQPTLRPGKLTVRMRHEELPRFGQDSISQHAQQDSCEKAREAARGAPPDSMAAMKVLQCSTKARPDEELYVDERQAEIWTSEGRTSPTVVKVHAFRPRYFSNGELERPCWLDQQAKAQIPPAVPVDPGAGEDADPEE